MINKCLLIQSILYNHINRTDPIYFSPTDKSHSQIQMHLKKDGTVNMVITPTNQKH